MNMKKSVCFYSGDYSAPAATADIYCKNDGVYLGNFEIAPEHRNKGNGSRLLQYLIKQYEINTLVVEKSNAVAIHVYEKCGFKIQKEYFAEDMNATVYQMKRAEPEDPEKRK